ncbi:unnamed protein product [Symbiodinium necroappetens]|uniref:Uncharacterized protein n=1 Tax=Symbiodinium necroappetens TaxID=1628268 RepID=A0A813BRJ8_9DINO|nr:unnamed protein product [Symbiodinium necroappetens]
MVCSDNVPAQRLYECLGYLQIFQAQLFQLQKCGDSLPSKGGSSSLILPLHLLRSLRIVQDPWAVRAVPADNGEIDRIRVMNFGYSKGLSKARGMVPGLLDRRSRAAVNGSIANLAKAQMLSRTWSSLASQLGGNGSNSRETEELAFDLQKSDFIVAVEQAAVGNSGSLGAQLLFITVPYSDQRLLFAGG